MPADVTEEEEDTFVFGPYAWDIRAATKTAADLPTKPLGLAGAFSLLPWIGVNEEHARTVDLTQPVIVVEVEELSSPVLVDGWHRVTRARNEGLATLPCKLLTPDLEFQVRLWGGRKGLPPRPDHRARRRAAQEGRPR